MVLDLVARWTRGDPMPESRGTVFAPVNVGLYGCEDDVSSIVLPRLMAAGADLDRVVFFELDKTKPILPDQVDRLRELCREEDVQVLVLDNVENGMGQTETHTSASLRAALKPLADFGIPVIAIHHPKKGASGGSAREAMSGSQAYTNVARSTLMVIPDGEGHVALAAVKSNYVSVQDTWTLYFKIGSREVDGLNEPLPVIEWLGGDRTTADALMGKAYARQMEERNKELHAPRSLPPLGDLSTDSGASATNPSLRLDSSSNSGSAPEIPQSRSFPRSSSLVLTPPTPPSPKNVPQTGSVQDMNILQTIGNTALAVSVAPQGDLTGFEGGYLSTACGNPQTAVSSLVSNTEEGRYDNVAYSSGDRQSNCDPVSIDQWVLDQQQKYGYGQFKKEEE
jgi:hypothetical protein